MSAYSVMKTSPRFLRSSLRAISTGAVLAGLAVSLYAQSKPTPPKEPQKTDLSKGNTMFVVPYAHLDTQWRWAYPQVIREYIFNTLHDNFALIEKYPHYIFNFSGSRRYEMMKEYYPDMYEQLKKYVAAGRWFPCGSSVDEGDANVPSGESLIRHVLYGNRFFRHEFGVASHEFMLPDCFGFPYALPSILAHCGVQGFSTQKLTWHSAVGIPFKVGNWIGPDGNSVVAALDPGSYGGAVTEDLSQNTSWLARIQNTGKISGAFVDYHYYGTGDIGGAPGASSVDWVEKSIAGTGPIKVISSRSDQMFRDLTPQQIAKLPTYQGELLLVEHSAGSVTSQAYMKRWNRKNEQLADGAERASVAAMWMGGYRYPSQRLYNAWDLVLGSQMHDMLPGTSIPKAYEFCWNDELLAQNQFAAVETDAVGSISSALDTSGAGTPIVVYNPLSQDRSDLVEATIPASWKGVQIVGPDGKPAAVQIIGSDGSNSRIVFQASVPSVGFAVYHATRTEEAPASTLKVSERVLENDKLRVTLNDAGDIASIYDKANGQEALSSPTRLEFQYENPKQFPAWNMDWEDQQKPPRAVLNTTPTFKVVENGSARVAIEVTREMDGSKFTQTIRLAKDSGEVEVKNTIDWQTRETALKFAIPLTSANPNATYDLQLGAIARGNNNPTKYEVPQHQWLDMTNPAGTFGVGVLNDCKFGSDKPSDDTVRMTLIYTPGVQGGYADQATQDFGRHEILLAIRPHEGDWRAANIPAAAERLNQPLRAFTATAHPGKLGKSFSLFSVDSPQVSIQSIKKAEDGDEIIVRLREHSGSPAKMVHIKSAVPINSARELNGQEMPIGTATVHDGKLMTDITGFGLKTFALKLAPANAKTAPASSKPVNLTFDADVVSTDKKRDDGQFGSTGEAIAAELFPAKLNIDGIDFKLGPTKDGAKNAVTARGQSISIPAGFNRVYLLASAEGDTRGDCRIGADRHEVTFQDWTGYVGQWDNRLWAGDPGPNFTNYGEMIGLVPGFVKKSEVAWFGSHTHLPSGNTFYKRSYLYKYGFDVPAGATSITLPNDSKIHVFAVSVAKNTDDEVAPSVPLYDQLDDRDGATMPSISPASGQFSDATQITINPPLYHTPGGLHYTLDGTDPTASSPVYSGPITIADPTTVKAAEISSTGEMGSVVTATIDVRDTTAPKVVSVSSPKALGLARVVFNEQVNIASAQSPENYQFASGVKVVSAQLMPDRRTVELALSDPLRIGTTESVTIKGIKDLAKNANVLTDQTMTVAEASAVFTAPELAPGVSKRFQVAELPVKAEAHFTVNMFVKPEKMPENLTIIGGFGRGTDGRTGTGRYFTKMANGITFWAANADTFTKAQLDLGKWQMLTATYDGRTLTVYKNGEKVGEQEVRLNDDQPVAQAFPLDAWDRKRKFEGEIRDFTIWDQDLPEAAIKRLYAAGKS